MLSIEMEQHLMGTIVPFWDKLRDTQHGGYYGFVDFDGTVHKEADKGGILHLRILWFFSNVYEVMGGEIPRENMEHAYSYVIEQVLDPVEKGAFWSIKPNGEVADATKHTYCQGFAIYALTAYYKATGKEEALDKAKEIYTLIEEKCKDEVGYMEAFDRHFEPISNDKLSENGVIAHKTMNTLLHVMEAYTELYRVTEDARVGASLGWILDCVKDKVYNPKLRRQEVFFDEQMRSIIDLHSYGHDIEAAWLLDRACEVLKDPVRTAFIREIASELEAHIYERALVDGSLINEAENGVDDTYRIWWVQAEALVGFYNGYEKAPQKKHYLQAVNQLWTYIQEKMVDQREGFEWFWRVSADGEPDASKPFVEPWKCPYHNGRMCIEIIRRNQDVASNV